MFNFDRKIDRSHTDSVKWRTYPPDVLPLWVADMDFQAPPVVLDAIRAQCDMGVLGYGSHFGNDELLAAWIERLEARFSWRLPAEAILPVPGVVTGANLACRALGSQGEQALVPAPVYGPLLSAPCQGQLECVQVALACDSSGYACMDMDALAQAVNAQTRVLVLCNPHNPVGRVFTRLELDALAEFALRHDLYVISDEIHCDFVYDGLRHIPIASLGTEIADRTITLMAPSKTYNIAGLHSSVAVVTNAVLRARLQAAGAGIMPGLDSLAKAATVAALRYGQPWLDELLLYLTHNRDILVTAVRTMFPGMAIAPPQGTYLAWLDCRAADLGQPAYTFFLEHARVALNNGCSFGEGNEGFARLNFGCPRSILEQALDRMASAWQARPGYANEHERVDAPQGSR